MMNQFPDCIPCLPDQLMLTNLISCQYITQVESGMEIEVFICPSVDLPTEKQPRLMSSRSHASTVGLKSLFPAA